MASPKHRCPDVQLAAFVFNAAGSGLTFSPAECNTNGTMCQRSHVPSGLLLRCSSTQCTFGPQLPEAGVAAPLDCAIVEAPCSTNGGGAWSCSGATLRGAGPLTNAAGLQ